MSLSNSNDLVSYQETKSKYLDGRYFNVVLANLHEGVVQKSLKIKIKNDPTKGSVGISAKLDPSHLKHGTINIIRVVVESPDVRHSCLLIIDFDKMILLFWNPKSTCDLNPVDVKIINIVKEYVSIYGDIEFRILYDTVPPVPGFCNAYVIKFALDWIMARPFDGKDIKRFASFIETHFKEHLFGYPDVEYLIFGPHVARTALVVGAVARR